MTDLSVKKCINRNSTPYAKGNFHGDESVSVTVKKK